MNPRDVETVPADDDEAGEARDLPSRLGHFEIVGRLGAGGMGMVLEARDLRLERRVAIKLLHPARAGGHVAPERLVREAQALAKLSHPNVVTVYEVGMAGDDPFVAMELVEGSTLFAWMAEPHDWRAVIDMFLAIGRGLAAVHALGLVHRDVKPSNVLIDAHGVPKLGDFGLAVLVDDLANDAGVVGTPAYMPPEQLRGEAVDARADQYAFAKALHEALREPYPAALKPILERALADDRTARYATMAELLDALARVRRAPRMRWIVAGGVLAVAALAVAFVFGRAGATSDLCVRPTDRLATVWSDARRTTVGSHLASIDAAQGKPRFAAAAAVIDGGGARWLDLEVETCTMAHDGRQSNALVDRRTACLDHALLELDDTVRALERAGDRVELDDAVRTGIRLPTLDDCGDVAALTELLPRPTDPAKRAEADALAREVVAIDVALRTGGTKDLAVGARAAKAVERARVLGDPETLARTLAEAAAIQMQLETGATTLVTLREAITASAAAHDDRLSAELWVKLLTQTISHAKPADAQTLFPAAEAAVARIKATPQIEAQFLFSKGQVLAANHDIPHAQALFAQALAKLEAAGASTKGSPLRALVVEIRARDAATHGKAGDWHGMADGLRAVLPLAVEVYGADHASLVRLHFNLGIALQQLGDPGAAAEYREAARIGEARLAPSPSLADTLIGVGNALLAANQSDDAVPYLERATAMHRATLPPGDPRLAESLGRLAGAYQNLGRYDDARPLWDEAIATLDRREVPPDVELADMLFNRGRWFVETHHCDGAWVNFDRATAAYRALAKPDQVMTVLHSVEECQLDVERFQDALANCATIIASPDTPDDIRLLAKLDHGKALGYMGRVREGVVEVRAAREALTAAGATDDAANATRWLEKHGAK